jgi:hypothetical protein
LLRASRSRAKTIQIDAPFTLAPEIVSELPAEVRRNFAFRIERARGRELIQCVAPTQGHREGQRR